MKIKPIENINNYLYYIEKAPSNDELSIEVKFSYLKAYSINYAK